MGGREGGVLDSETVPDGSHQKEADPDSQAEAGKPRVQWQVERHSQLSEGSLALCQNLTCAAKQTRSDTSKNHGRNLPCAAKLTRLGQNPRFCSETDAATYVSPVQALFDGARVHHMHLRVHSWPSAFNY